MQKSYILKAKSRENTLFTATCLFLNNQDYAIGAQMCFIKREQLKGLQVIKVNAAYTENKCVTGLLGRSGGLVHPNFPST
jgi:hypothetical protein